MAKQVKRRRGTTAEHATFPGVEGEITVDTDLQTIVVHNGTAPGKYLMRADGFNMEANSVGIVQLDVTDGDAGDFLQTDGNNNLSFEPIPSVASATVGALGGDISGTIANALIRDNKVGVDELAVTEAGGGGSAGHFLKTDGSGTLSFAAVVTDPTMGGDIGGTTSVSVIQPAAVEGSMLDPALKQFTEDASGETPPGGYNSVPNAVFPAGDGSTTTYTLSVPAVASNNSLVVSIDGIMQPTQSYSLPTSTSIQFDDPPPTGSSIRILHIGFQVTVSTPADGAITTAKLGGGAVTNTKLADSASTDSIRAVTTNHIRDDAVTTAKIAQDAVTATEIAPGTITGTEISNASITGLDIASNAIDGSHIAIGTAQGDTMYFDGTNWVKLTYGTTGHVLTTAGVNSNPYWAAGSSGTALPSVGNVGDVLTNVGGGWVAADPQEVHLEGEKLVSSQLFTSGTGTWTRPANITKIEVWVVGAGGGSNSGSTSAGGGGGGGTAYSILDVTNIATASYVVGSSSTAAGNLSSFNTTLVGNGGGGSTDNNAGGGGVGSGAAMQINFPGAGGGFSGSLADGGESHFGGNIGRGAVGANPTLSQSGTPGCVYIKEYSDPSLSLLGAGVVGEEIFTSDLNQSTNQSSGGDASSVQGVWTKPLGVKSIEVTCIGGGGRGGAGQGQNSTGGNGGKGGVGRQFLDVRNITSLPYKIGLGGGIAGGPPWTGHVHGGTTAFGCDNDIEVVGPPQYIVTVTAGAIDTIVISSQGGTGFTVAPLVSIESFDGSIGYGQGGTGATATAAISGTAVTTITVTNGGSGYIQNEVNVFFGLCGGSGGINGLNPANNYSGATGANGVGYGNTNNIHYNNVNADIATGNAVGYGAGSPGVGDLNGANNNGFAAPGVIIIKSYK